MLLGRIARFVVAGVIVTGVVGVEQVCLVRCFRLIGQVVALGKVVGGRLVGDRLTVTRHLGVLLHAEGGSTAHGTNSTFDTLAPSPFLSTVRRIRHLRGSWSGGAPAIDVLTDIATSTCAWSPA